MKKNLFKAILILIMNSAVCLAQTNNEIFEKMVGREAAMDPGINVQFLRDKPGHRFAVDSDSDGRIDIIYKIDSAEKHLGKRAPLLVKIVDEDGDMYLTGEGDQDSDLYVADWYGDGTIDRVVDYIDKDRDGDVDEQVLYQWTTVGYILAYAPTVYNGRAYCVSWSRDCGDDNRLWYYANYEYDQRLTEWKSDFNGDEMFVYLFYFDFEKGTLFPGGEIAFSFYDPDGDNLSEETVRFEGAGQTVRNVRFSMDIDNDTRAGNEHDFDFSITGLGPVTLPANSCTTLSFRGTTADPVMGWELMRSYAKSEKWSKTHLTWDENDNNVDLRPGSIQYERWEGVLNHGNEYMPQVGGPSCGAFNKRNEIDIDGSGKLGLYFSPVDQRFHLAGAELGWIEVDYDYDNRLDMVIRMEDTNRDGFFDTWKYDIDADSVFDRQFSTTAGEESLYSLEHASLSEAYLLVLEKALDDNEQLITMLKASIGKYCKREISDQVEDYFASKLIDFGKKYHLGEKIVNSSEGKRYYTDLIRERYWYRLCEIPTLTDSKDFQKIKVTYESGDYADTARILKEHVFPNTMWGR
ncbi:MAG: hypothetical protein HOC71_11615 [Candidatus Latescibacteria bacterium]|jgi:hypothetical protein|nr:hypothetical protein [Candidatus Latescibacterota bacterium]